LKKQGTVLVLWRSKLKMKCLESHALLNVFETKVAEVRMTRICCMEAVDSP
jgi:hypothetical protein